MFSIKCRNDLPSALLVTLPLVPTLLMVILPVWSTIKMRGMDSIS